MAALFLLVGCTQEEELHMAQGKLRFVIGQVSTQTGTRAVPADLDAPIHENFKLKLQRQGSGNVVYEGDFVSELELRIGTYHITATHGDNVVIGRDTPYYIGTATGVVTKDASSAITIPCKVGNALVSVQFGRNETERARFSRYYSDCGLLVQVGDYSMSISQNEETSSIYFPAGSRPEFIFYGTLVADGRLVSTTLSHNNIPEVFEAADHAKLTLTLPDPESALGVNIGKVEMESVDLGGTIPLSWLPVSSAVAEHQYLDGMLVGTNLSFTTSYPGMTWEARVSNAQGDTIRTVTGKGALVSNYTSSEDWPFLPAGKYKATYFLHSESGVNKVSSREFMIAAPQLKVKLDGYTSYDKYLAGEIEAANGCNGLTLYAPQVSVNITPDLIANARYGYQMTYNLDGTSGNATGNTQNLGNKELDARLTAYNLSAKATFAGQEATASKDFYITGVPFLSEPPTTSDWESSGDYVTFETDYVRLGHNAWNSEQYITYNKVAIPVGTRLFVDYKVICHSAAFKADFTLNVGEKTIVSGTDDQELKGEAEITTDAATTYVRCHNDGGQAQAYADVYRVALRYKK